LQQNKAAVVVRVVSQGRLEGRLKALSRPSHSREFRESETNDRNPRRLGVADGSHQTSSFQHFAPPILPNTSEKSKSARGHRSVIAAMINVFH